MFCRTRNQLTVLCGVVALSLAMPTESRAGRIWDCMFGSGPPSQTTYVPPYAPAYVTPVVVAPPCADPVPACQQCQPCQSICVPTCGFCAPQTCQYMPGVVYRALYPPTVVTAYQPVAACSTCVGYGAVTTYRPFLGTYETRLVPYTTYYRPVYVPVVSYAYSPYTSCSSAPPVAVRAIVAVLCRRGVRCNDLRGARVGLRVYAAPRRLRRTMLHRTPCREHSRRRRTSRRRSRS